MLCLDCIVVNDNNDDNDEDKSQSETENILDSGYKSQLAKFHLNETNGRYILEKFKQYFLPNHVRSKQPLKETLEEFKIEFIRKFSYNKEVLNIFNVRDFPFIPNEEEKR